jgi:hypothetical protein
MLHKAVLEVCRLKLPRAKVVCGEEGKIYVYHCDFWSEECTYLLDYYCPNAVLSMETSSASLTGFVVVVREAQLWEWTRQRLMLALLVSAIAYGLLFFAREPIMMTFFK